MRLALGISLLLAAGGANEALAQAPAADPAADEAARGLFLNGSRLYEEGRYEEAIVAFNEAYRLSQRPGLLLNLGNAYERLGRLAEAVEALNRYRVYAPPEDQDKLASRVLMLERRLAEQASVAPPEPAPTVVTPTPAAAASRQPRPLPWAAVGTGAALVVAGSITTAATASRGMAARELGDQEAYEAVRPLNNVSFGGAVGGGVVLGIGVVGLVVGRGER